jgi:glycosyltransferase involved in cell wall biosynthesis
VPEYPAAATTVGAHTDVPEVLFLARLHARKRPGLFVEMARRLLADGVHARFTLVGPDAGEGAAVLAAIGDEPRISWEGPVDPQEAPLRMARASAYVLPAEREPYPMSVLEAMSVGLPVVVCRDCGLAPVVSGSRSGQVAEGTVEDLAAAVRSVLADPYAYGRRARETARRDFAMSAVADRLLTVYRHAVTR